MYVLWVGVQNLWLLLISVTIAVLLYDELHGLQATDGYTIGPRHKEQELLLLLDGQGED